MTTSLVCSVAASAGAVTVGTEVAGCPEADAASLRGELCCVDTVPGLRPFTGHSSPGGRKPESGEGDSVKQLFLLLNEI